MKIIIPRKIKASLTPQLAIGAVMETGEVFFDEKMIKHLHISEEYLQRRMKVYYSFDDEKIINWLREE